MGSIKSSIELYDNFSTPMMNFINSINMGVGAAENFQRVISRPVDNTAYVSMQNDIDSAVQAVNELQMSLASLENPSVQVQSSFTNLEQPVIDIPDVEVPVTPYVTGNVDIQTPEDITVPVTPYVTEQPTIDVPDSIDVPVTADTSPLSQYQTQLDSIEGIIRHISNIQEQINSQAENQMISNDELARLAEINGMIDDINARFSAMQNSPFDLGTETAVIQMRELGNAIQDVLADQQALDKMLSGSVQINAPLAQQVPVIWQSDSIETFTSSGIERFQQEVQSANNMLNTLNQTQSRIAAQAASTNIFPSNMVADMSGMETRLQAIQTQIQRIENNPLNMGTDEANAELERLRGQLDQAVQQQQAMNTAIDSMDMSAANAAYLELSQTVANTERYIRDNVTEQGQFNSAIQQGTQQANNLFNMIGSAIAAYATVHTVSFVLDASDELTSTMARLNLMNDGLQTTDDLVDMVYMSAQNARGSFSDMAGIVAKLGNNAGDAFSSSAEIVTFAELVQKQMTIAGTSTTEASNAMLQLTQALGSGVLRGDELNSIFEQAPNLIQNIADYMGVDIGAIRELASEGEISADIVRNAILSASDEINKQFESMPMTWAQIWQSMQNTAFIAFEPVLNRLNEIANTDSFQMLTENAVNALAMVANIVLNIFDLICNVAGVVYDNWSWISPLVYGVAAAFGVYYGWQLLTATATAAMTAAQWAYNAAMSANPVMLVVIGIIALIAAIYAVCSAIAQMTGVANSGFGVITGGISVVIAFFQNLGLSVANIALGIWSAIGALCTNMMAAFSNAISSIQSWFYDLLSTAMSVIAGIASALNSLPFVEFDYSGITAAADDYAAKSAAAASNKQEYTSVSDAFSSGAGTFDTFQSGWASKAFSSGASWGDGVVDSISSALDPTNLFSTSDIPTATDYAYSGGNYDLGGIPEGVDDIAGNTGSIADSMDITQEELKYVRDLAEQDIINRYTNTEFTINQENHNNISNGMDLDGVMTKLTDQIREAREIAAEGDHD